MTRLATLIVTGLLVRDSKDATYKFAMLRTIVPCVTEQRVTNGSMRIRASGKRAPGMGKGPHPPERPIHQKTSTTGR